MADKEPELHEMPDGSIVAYFDADGNMIDDPDKAETARILKPDGTFIFAARAEKQPAQAEGE